MARSVLITGGTGGLGTTVTSAFLADGWRVVVPWVAEQELSRVTEHPNLTLVQADLFETTGAAEVARIAGDEPSAPLTAVVNLVGGFGMDGKVHEAPIEAFERQLRLNLRPTYLVCQAALPTLVAGGGGSIVCMSSRAALHPFPGASGYITSKAAVLSLVDAMAAEYEEDGVRVNAVLPSVIDTPANRANQPDADYSSWVPPQRIAEVIQWLCSDGAGVVSGAHVPVYGVG